MNLLTPVGHGFQASFFTCEGNNSYVKAHEEEIRTDAEEWMPLGEFENATKLYIKLVDNSNAKSKDIEFLNQAITRLFNLFLNEKDIAPYYAHLKTALENGFNFSQINTIVSNWPEKPVAFVNPELAKKVHTHLLSKIEKLSDEFYRMVDNSLLLLKSEGDEKCHLAQLPKEIKRLILAQWLNMIKNICMTPVDIRMGENGE